MGGSSDMVLGFVRTAVNVILGCMPQATWPQVTALVNDGLLDAIARAVDPDLVFRASATPGGIDKKDREQISELLFSAVCLTNWVGSLLRRELDRDPDSASAQRVKRRLCASPIFVRVIESLVLADQLHVALDGPRFGDTLTFSFEACDFGGWAQIQARPALLQQAIDTMKRHSLRGVGRDAYAAQVMCEHLEMAQRCACCAAGEIAKIELPLSLTDPECRPAAFTCKHKPLHEVSVCGCCGEPVGGDRLLMKCGGCKLATYCSRGCQRDAWKLHKPVCAAYCARGKDAAM